MNRLEAMRERAGLAVEVEVSTDRPPYHKVPTVLCMLSPEDAMELVEIAAAAVEYRALRLDGQYYEASEARLRILELAEPLMRDVPA